MGGGGGYFGFFFYYVRFPRSIKVRATDLMRANFIRVYGYGPFPRVLSRVLSANTVMFYCELPASR